MHFKPLVSVSLAKGELSLDELIYVFRYFIMLIHKWT